MAISIAFAKRNQVKEESAMIYQFDGGMLTLELYDCQNWQSPEDLFAILEEIQNHFAWTWYFRIGISERPEQIIPPDQFRSVVHRRSTELVQGGFSPYPPLEIIAPYNAINRAGESCTMSKFADLGVDSREIKKVIFRSHAYSRRLFKENKDDSSIIDPVSISNQLMDRYVALARFLIPRLQPLYLWASEDDYDLFHSFEGEWKKGEFEVLHWLNYFRPGILSEEQKALFDNPPFGFVEHFPDGGLWYQLSEDFEQLGRTPQEFIDMERGLIKHFASLGIGGMIWKFFGF
jgi:hypothetical protein